MVSVDRKGISIPDERGAAVVCGGEEEVIMIAAT
jgi:hypothetical protein